MLKSWAHTKQAIADTITRLLRAPFHVIGALIRGIVITHPAANTWLLLAVLGLPALFALYALTRALTVTTVDTPYRRGSGRR